MANFRLIKFFLYFILVVSVFACKKDSVVVFPIDPIKEKPQKILFIGNSHTYYNGGLDFYLKNFVDANDSLRYDIITREARSGYRLEQHWNEIRTRDAISNEDWDIIILQENSYVAYKEPENLLPIVEKFNSLVINSETELLLFMTWAYRDTASMIQNISSAYENTSDRLALSLVSVGYAWRDLLIAHPEIELHNPDGYHPDVTGSYLTAAIFYATLYEENPMENAYRPENMDEKVANLILESAWQAYLKYK